jgi:hypothetical protein
MSCVDFSSSIVLQQAAAEVQWRMAQLQEFPRCGSVRPYCQECATTVSSGIPRLWAGAS